jgi:hypothetical protein
MQQVLSILPPKFGEDQETNFDDEDDELDLVNSFAALDVEDIPEAQANSWLPPNVFHKKSKPKDKVEYELESKAYDLLFNIFCFYTDLNAMRTYLRKLWSQYCKGKIDLVVSSLRLMLCQ